MAVKNILVHVDERPASGARLDLALALAERDRAHLAAVHVYGTELLRGSAGARLPHALIEEFRQAAAVRAAATEALYRPILTAGDTTTEWRTVESLDPDVLIGHARYVDLAIVGQDDPEDPQAMDGAAEMVVMGSGRPTLVVPYAGRFPTVGREVLVAWDGGREAARAVNDALPLLQPNARVTVLSLDPDRTAAGAAGYPGQDIATHLARHGIQVEIASYGSGDLSVGDWLLSRAADLGADMIVMGAYGHARLREYVLGGVTRHMLAHMTVPVLMSH